MWSLPVARHLAYAGVISYAQACKRLNTIRNEQTGVFVCLQDV